MKLKIVLLTFFTFSASLFAQQVNMSIKKEIIPTYEIGNPEINPIFFTGRVYQGAEGYIYPYPLYDILTEQKTDKEYTLLHLSNQYVNIGVLPEIGGRIFSATDKTNNYSFFYTQTGVKPALIGMLGAWLSGGVEWNIPDHHQATSYMPASWKLKENENGSKTIWVGETEFRHRLKWSVGVTVYPNRSWVQANINVINPTPMIQSMLYWANVSVHCNNDYQVIFPPDTQAGADHHKVYFTKWPWGEAVVGSGKTEDLSWWKNYSGNSRSIFAWDSKMHFLAGYDFGKDAGTVHVANRHLVPGKKFFLWGNNANGEMWNKILSDNDGHYLELMVGAYSDNQPDYSWINPGEIREFSQLWYPIKGIKGVKNATVDAAVNFVRTNDSHYLVGYCATQLYTNARVLVKYKEDVLFDKTISIDPDNFFLTEVPVSKSQADSLLYTALYDASGNVLVEYSPVVLEEQPLPRVIDGTKPVKEYKTNEELYLAGLRIDQFNNARLDYMAFYNEALLRDSMDARVNIEVGKHFIRQGAWEKAKAHLLRAQTRLSHDYTTVKNNEALYYLGYIFQVTGHTQQAEEAYWKATWTPEFKHRSYYELAVLSVKDKKYSNALELINSSLYVGARDLKALMLKAYILRQLDKKAEATQVIANVQQIDPLDYWSAAENSFLNTGNAGLLKHEVTQRSEGLIGVQEVLEVATNYITIGATQDAIALLSEAITWGASYAEYPLIHYYLGYNKLIIGDKTGANSDFAEARSLSPLNNYPFRTEEIELFNTICKENPNDSFAYYYLGNLLYYLGQKEAGLTNWLKSAELNPKFSIACRNAGFGLDQQGNTEQAIDLYNKAIKANPDNALLFTESDKLYEKAQTPAATRLKQLESNLKTVLKHDDAVMRLLSLYNETGAYDKAIKILKNRHFHLWEGGGQIHDIYVDAHLLKGIELLNKKKYNAAINEFDMADQYPVNLEVARPYTGGYTAKIYHLIGIAYESLNQPDKAKISFEKSAISTGSEHLSDLTYYKVKSLKKLTKETEATALIKQMQQNLKQTRSNTLDTEYAKFGDANLLNGVRQSKLAYYSGLIQLLQGNTVAAENDFKQAIQLNPSNSWAKSIRKNSNL